ncbi:unnamed protein product [Rhizophagus irregularis]|nr:unnamed protein product [Rhizophagus irregularis]
MNLQLPSSYFDGCVDFDRRLVLQDMRFRDPVEILPNFLDYRMKSTQSEPSECFFINASSTHREFSKGLPELVIPWHGLPLMIMKLLQLFSQFLTINTTTNGSLSFLLMDLKLPIKQC